MSETAAISPDAKPRLPRGVRLTHNEAQGGWVLLAPERVFKADPIAAEIVKRCTGEATMNEIVDDRIAFKGQGYLAVTRETWAWFRRERRNRVDAVSGS